MRVLIYVRISVGDKTPAADKQITQCRAFAGKLGATETVEYVDEGLQCGDERPEFARMLNDFSTGDIIVALQADRITRKFDEFMHYREKYNLKFVNDLDTSFLDVLPRKMH
jgi:DNA invertase Pin-like site-specific DNA recombinase